MNDKKLTEGWISLYNARKFHYARDGRTLCGKFLYLGASYSPDTGSDHKNDCAACSKKLRAERKS